jgi:RNA polymerase-binding transcription factor DksA
MKSAPKKIPSKWAWHKQALLRLRAKLREARDEHDHAARVPHERGGADALDFAEDEVELRTLRTELAQEDFELSEIEAALARLKNGTYGRCEVTNRPIAAARLRAIPWTRLSKAAAEQREVANRGPAGKQRRAV